jgi:broad specificity phosphatase PhoE
LTALGRQQATGLARALALAGIEHIYHSPLQRAVQTAAILVKTWQVDADIVNNLRERNRYGVLTGVTKAEAAAQNPKQVAKLADVHSMLRSGEAYEPFWQRVQQALQIITASQLIRVGVVTHSGPISTIGREMLGLGEVSIADCGYLVLEINHAKPRLLQSHGIDFISSSKGQQSRGVQPKMPILQNYVIDITTLILQRISIN